MGKKGDEEKEGGTHREMSRGTMSICPLVRNPLNCVQACVRVVYVSVYQSVRGVPPKQSGTVNRVRGRLTCTCAKSASVHVGTCGLRF